MFEINPFPNVKSSRMSKTSRAKSGILAATEEYLLAAMALNLKRMVNAIFRYLQIYCSAGTTVGSSRIFAFVNRSVIVHYLCQQVRYCTLSKLKMLVELLHLHY